MNKFRSYEFDPHVLMCSIECDASNDAAVQLFNQMYLLFMDRFRHNDSFATVTPFGVHMRLSMSDSKDALSLPGEFEAWIASAFADIANIFARDLDMEVPACSTDYTIVPSSLLDPESFKKRVQAALDSDVEVKNE